MKKPIDFDYIRKIIEFETDTILTNKDLYQFLEVEQRTFCNWQKKGDCKISIILKISEHFGIEIKKLITPKKNNNV